MSGDSMRIGERGNKGKIPIPSAGVVKETLCVVESAYVCGSLRGYA